MQKNKLIIVAVIAVVLLAIVALLVVLFVGIVIWQLGMFNILSPIRITSTGFAKIKPQLAAARFNADGTFSGLFTNGVGTVITVDQAGVVVSDASGQQCTTASIEPASLRAGDNFRLTASGCGVRRRGDVYTLAFSIPYNVTIGNITKEYTEHGNIKGPVE